MRQRVLTWCHTTMQLLLRVHGWIMKQWIPRQSCKKSSAPLTQEPDCLVFFWLFCEALLSFSRHCSHFSIPSGCFIWCSHCLSLRFLCSVSAIFVTCLWTLRLRSFTSRHGHFASLLFGVSASNDFVVIFFVFAAVL